MTTIVTNNATLFSNYQQLQQNDIICGRIRLRPGEEYLLTDLLDRGVHLIPSATAQLASRSKVFQAQLFAPFMIPGTRTIHDQHSLLRATAVDHHLQGEVVLKRDNKNGGIGIHRFRSMEELYNLVCGGGYPFPFVIQPFQPDCRDIRVIILGDYIEAYERESTQNFRHNLHCGGSPSPYTLSESQLSLCRKIMARATFPYAHIDLLLQRDQCWLSEINLRGGLRGAKICGRDYLAATEHIHQQLVSEILERSGHSS